MHRAVRTLLIFVSPLLSACASSTAFYKIAEDLRPIPIGRVADQTLRIVAEDSSFALEAGTDFKSPFQASATLVTNDLKLVPSVGWREALEVGAKRVFVYRGKERFYGVLALLPATKKSKGPASNNYRIQVPEIYAAAARNGRLAHMGEFVEFDSFGPHWTWILWISDSAFAM